MSIDTNSLKDLMEDVNKNFPEQAQEAMEEYFENIPEKDILIKKIKASEEYKTTFVTSITQISLLFYLFINTIDNLNNIKIQKNNLDKTNEILNKKFLEEIQPLLHKYQREFMFFSRDDDVDIYNMKIFYFEHLNSKEIDFWDIQEVTKEQKIIEQYKKDKFDIILQETKNKYINYFVNK